MTCGIYRLSAPNGHCYIGSSRNAEDRMQGHHRALERGIHCNRHLQAAFNKHGSLIRSLVLTCRLEDLLLYEQACIDGLRPEYNLSRIAGTVQMTPEVLERLAAKRSSPEHKAKRSSLAKAQWQTPGFRERHAASVSSPEVKANHSSKIRAYFSSPEARAKKSAEAKLFTCTPEFRAAASARSKARWADKEFRAKMLFAISESTAKRASAASAAHQEGD